MFAVSGRMEAEQVVEVKALFESDYRDIILDFCETSGWRIATQ